MVRLPAQVVRPEAFLPEPEAFHLFVVVAKRRIRQWLALKVHVPQLFHVRAHHLIGIHKDYLLQVQGKEHVQEEHLVRPDNPLLLCLLVEPRWPLIRNELEVKAVLTAQTQVTAISCQ